MKKFTAVLVGLLAALTLTACGGGNDTKTVTIDTAKLASELVEETVTSDTLSESTTDLTSIYFYKEEDVTSAVMYASSGTTACEVAIIESKEASNTEEVEQLFQTRVENQSSLYASYNAAEASRLETAIIKSTGVYTVLCVCDDVDKANEILEGYGF